MRDPQGFLRLLQLELSARSPGAPVLNICLELKPVKPRTEQHDLFQAMTPEPAKLEITLAKLANLLGADNVGTPEVVDTHRPDAFRMKRFTVTCAQDENPLPHGPALALRRFRPPTHVQVIQREEKLAHLSAFNLQGKVVALAGPWRSSGDWWNGEPWNRQEWDAVLSDGAIYRLHEDMRLKRWFVDGVYD